MYSIETRCIHGSEHKNEDSNFAISYPIYQTASFSHLTPGHNPTGFDYSRESNPTRQYLEETVSSLEGACDSIAFSSGMAALSCFFDRFAPGDHIICGEDLYGGTVRLFDRIAKKNGLEIEYADTTDPKGLRKLIKDNTKAVYFETPTNPMMQVTDIEAVAKIAHERKILVCVDNTFMTPYFQNPIKEGADVVIHSGTKYLCGHNDTVCGFLCVADSELAADYRLLSKTTGATLGPFECWLCLRGLKTLSVRMERHKENAERVSEWLKGQSEVSEVFYVGSGMVSFYVKSKEKAVSILKNIKLITFAESLGGTESLLTYPTVQTHPDVPVTQKEKLGINDRLLRMSVGIESANDIIADLKQAFEAK
ncbi:MAG: PLP-dependent aspartate aminotransferase family protein [Lachnospiraceae bacterium]|nr:PLP-dependent aspartate aminotransferase family protein [Lachnospiraceae bacterium]